MKDHRMGKKPIVVSIIVFMIFVISSILFGYLYFEVSKDTIPFKIQESEYLIYEYLKSYEKLERYKNFFQIIFFISIYSAIISVVLFVSSSIKIKKR